MSPRRIATPTAGVRLRRTVPDTTRNAIEIHLFDAQSLLGLVATRLEALADVASGDTSRELTALALVADAAADRLDTMQSSSSARRSRPRARRRVMARRSHAAMARAQYPGPGAEPDGDLSADQATIRTLTQRVQLLERTVRTFLGARQLTAPQRQELVLLLAGVRAPADDTAEKGRWVADQYHAQDGQTAIDLALVAFPRRPVAATAPLRARG